MHKFASFKSSVAAIWNMLTAGAAIIAFTFGTAFITMFCTACSDSDDVAGGISEETNTLAGVLLDSKGNGVSGVAVVARHIEVDSIVLADTTGSDGAFGLPLKRQGQYGISAVVDSSAYYETVDYDGNEISVSASLKPAGKISGTMNLRSDTVAANVSVYIPGSRWVTETDENGEFTLEGIPFGIVPLFAKSPNPVQFNDAVYVVEVGKKSTTFKGPVPFENFEVFAEDSLDEDIALLTEADNETLLFPLSTEYGVRSWWSMDYLTPQKNKTSVVSDVRGGTENMLVYGGAELDSGVNNSALVLDGAKKYGVVENDRGVLDSATAIVLEAWLLVDSVLSDEDSFRKNIIGKVGFGSLDDQDVFSLALVKGECGAKKPSLAFFVASGDGDSLSCKNAAVAESSLDVGSWVYVTAVWNGESISLYQNGVLSGEKTVSVKQINVSSEPIFFGKEAINLKLDDVRLGVKAITAADVLFRYYLKGGAK